MSMRAAHLAVLTVLLGLSLPSGALGQEPENPPPSPPAASDSTKETPRDQTGEPKHAAQETPTPNAGVPAGPPAKKKAKPQLEAISANPAPSTATAAQLAQSLDNAIQAAKRMGIAPPASWASAGQNGFEAKSAQLKAALDTAKTPADVDKVIAQYASAFAEILPLIARGNSMPESPRPAETNPALPPGAPASSTERSVIYLACGALLLSLVAPLGGWLLARREVKKALAEAGLI